jgi:16S rRNA (guanine(966)-N(2))-methyltransferase RsmD
MPATRPPPGRSAAHAVRIQGGRWKRTPLAVAEAEGLRPTPNRVRETLFNWLGQDLSGWLCIDLYAGSGALGLEAASRGASQVWLYDTAPRAVRNIEAVITRLQAETVCQVRRRDALAALHEHAEQSVDLVFIDPPFARGDPQAAPQPIAARAALPRLRARGLLYVEAPDAATLDAVARLEVDELKRARAGAVWFALFSKRAPSDPPADGAADPTQSHHPAR